MYPLITDKFVAVETLTTTTTSQQTAVAAGPDEVWFLTPSGGDMWVAFGPDPEAVVDECLLLKNGVPQQLTATADYKLAVIDVS